MQSRTTRCPLPSNAWFLTFRPVAIAICLVCLPVSAGLVSAQVNVWTYHNDNLRTGANLNETTLTPTNVNGNFFGLLFSCPVDGQVYAQPLVMSNIGPMPDGNTHNVVFAVTQHDGVYAFDADGPDACVQLWYRTFIDPDNGITTFPAGESRSGDITPELGITSTPVIDVNSGTLYVVVKTKEVRGDGNHYVQTLHALDMTSGADIVTPTVIGDTIFSPSPDTYTYVSGACVPGTGNGSIIINGQSMVCFNAIREHVRSGLVLANSVVYVAWASHGDNGPYHGWVIGYDATTLQQIDSAVFNTTPNGGLAGIWMGGEAPVVDGDGNMYFSTGNGTFAINDTDFCTHSNPPCNPAYGDSVVKLSTTGGLNYLDSFTPFNQLALDNADADLASGGVLALPDQAGAHPHVLLSAGKQSHIFLIDRDDFGGYQICGPMCDGVLFRADNMYSGEADDTPAYFNTGDEQKLYYLTAADHLKAFAVTADPPLIIQVADASPATTFGNKGATPSISADPTGGNAIVWALQSSGGTPAVLHAYDALGEPLMNELYNSNQSGARDRLGIGLKFTLPTVANGKVYVGTGTGPANTACDIAPGCLDVFGLFPQ